MPQVRELLKKCINRSPRVRRAISGGCRAACTMLESIHILGRGLLPVLTIAPSQQPQFFGYYDKSPWDATDRFLVFLRVPFEDRMPSLGDYAEVCLVDTENSATAVVLARTQAWCWQQGCMLQWLGNTRTLIFNDCDGHGFVSRIIDLNGNVLRTLPYPVYAVSSDGRQGMSLDFSRVHFARPGYGYDMGAAPPIDRPCPEDDGIWLVSLEREERRLVLSYRDASDFHSASRDNPTFHYFNHVTFNPDHSRVVFVHRAFEFDRSGGRGTFNTRLLSMSPDGTRVWLLEDSGTVSHFTWRDLRTLLVFGVHKGGPQRYRYYEDTTHDVTAFAQGTLVYDGHPSFSPDGSLLLTDTYPDRFGRQSLILCNPATEQAMVIGRYLAPPRYSGPLRCDLHPRWNHAGTHVCFDSTKDGRRSLCVVDVTERQVALCGQRRTSE